MIGVADEHRPSEWNVRTWVRMVDFRGSIQIVRAEGEA
ncbi:hypothetical protein LINPERHAP1_LOCUS12778, partial [Linum perenne]